jgi:uncharacterized membrane protein YtjA (UPF0391 family)
VRFQGEDQGRRALNLSFSFPKRREMMLRLAVLFFVVAVIAAVFGFGLVASTTYSIAKILFFIFLLLAVLSLLSGALRRPPP